LFESTIMSSSTRIVPAAPGFFHDLKPVVAWAISPNVSGSFDEPEWNVEPITAPDKFKPAAARPSTYVYKG